MELQFTEQQYKTYHNNMFIPFGFFGAQGSGYTPETDAFIAAVVGGGDTLTTTEKDAVDALVVDLQAASLFSTMGYLYPFVGGTSTSMKWNLRDTTTAEIAWYGGMTFNSQGIIGNASNSGGDSNLNPSTLGYTRMAIGFYLNQGLGLAAGGWYDMGMYDTSTIRDTMISYGFNGSTNKYVNLSGAYNIYTAGSYTNSTIWMQHDISNTKLYQGISLLGSTVNSFSISTDDVGIGCSWRRNAVPTGAPYGSTGRGFGLAFCSSAAYSGAQVTDLNNAITTFVTSLSRN